MFFLIENCTKLALRPFGLLSILFAMIYIYLCRDTAIDKVGKMED